MQAKDLYYLLQLGTSPQATLYRKRVWKWWGAWYWLGNQAVTQLELWVRWQGDPEFVPIWLCVRNCRSCIPSMQFHSCGLGLIHCIRLGKDFFIRSRTFEVWTWSYDQRNTRQDAEDFFGILILSCWWVGYVAAVWRGCNGRRKGPKYLGCFHSQLSRFGP